MICVRTEMPLRCLGFNVLKRIQNYTFDYPELSLYYKDKEIHTRSTGMRKYIENIPEWMQILLKDLREEAYHELERESKSFRYFDELSAQIQTSSKVCALVFENAEVKEGYSFTKEELQKLTDLIECNRWMETLISQRMYWKAWRDCIRSLRLAGALPGWEESYEEKIPSIFRN